MSSNFHDPHAFNFQLTAANLNIPLGQLDQAISDIISGTEGIDQLNIGSLSAKTIASGAITTSTGFITIDTESSAASDDLDTISGLATGDVVFARIANNSRIVRVTESGNISTPNDQNYWLVSTDALVMFVYDGVKVRLVPVKQYQIGGSAQSTLTIASGVATPVSRSRYVIDTESAAATDELETISTTYANDGDLLFLSIASNSRTVTVDHLGNNIYLSSEADILLDDTRQILGLIYNSANSRWEQFTFNTVMVKDNARSSSSSDGGKILKFPAVAINNADPRNIAGSEVYVDVMPTFFNNQLMMVQARGDATINQWGVNLTESGTKNAIDFPRGNFVRWVSGNVSGDLGGFVSSFNTYTPADNVMMTFECLFATHTSIATCRIFIGLASAAIGNNNDPATAGIKFIGLRYATPASDTTFKVVSSDGATSTIVDSGITVNTSNVYYIKILRKQTGYDVVIGDVTGAGGESTIEVTATLPTGALGINARIETREAVVKSLSVSRLYHTHAF